MYNSWRWFKCLPNLLILRFIFTRLIRLFGFGNKLRKILKIFCRRKAVVLSILSICLMRLSRAVSFSIIFGITQRIPKQQDAYSFVPTWPYAIRTADRRTILLLYGNTQCRLDTLCRCRGLKKHRFYRWNPSGIPPRKHRSCRISPYR